MRIFSHIAPRILGMALAVTCLHAQAQGASSLWSGIWQAQGSPFTLRVTQQNDELYIEPVESLGFIWSNGIGRINGQSAAVEVSYQGVTGTVLIQLGEGDTAMVRPLSCRPDFHIICTLVQNQQARFVKIDEAGARTTDAALRSPTAGAPGN